MTMRRVVLMALAVLSLAGCAATQTSATRANSFRDQANPALLRPDLNDDVTGGIQARDLNSVIRPAR
jgi:uncharacterized lipoprotein